MTKEGMMDARDYARLTGLSYQTVLNYAYGGIIPCKIIERHCYFTTEMLPLGLILHIKKDFMGDEFLDFYFTGSYAEEGSPIQPKMFKHEGCYEFNSLCEKITELYNEQLTIGSDKYADRLFEDEFYCKKAVERIETEKEESLEEFDRRWKKKNGDKEGVSYESSYKSKRDRIIRSYDYESKAVGKKDFDGTVIGEKATKIFREVMYEYFGSHVSGAIRKILNKSGIVQIYRYDTTKEDFDIADFIEQIVRVGKRQNNGVNVCISGQLPEYVVSICSRLKEMGVITQLVIQERSS